MFFSHVVHGAALFWALLSALSTDNALLMGVAGARCGGSTQGFATSHVTEMLRQGLVQLHSGPFLL